MGEGERERERDMKRVAAVSDAGTSRPSRHQDTHIKIKRVAFFFNVKRKNLCCFAVEL